MLAPTYPPQLPDSFLSRLQEVIIRPAFEADQDVIVALVTSERLNPMNLDWCRFWVAVCGSDIVGAAQIRRHRDGSREISSLVVAEPYRRQGIASRLLDALLADGQPDHYLVTGMSLAEYYSRWDFRRIGIARASRSIRKTFWLSQIGGFVICCIKRRKPRRLVVMHRGMTTLG